MKITDINIKDIEMVENIRISMKDARMIELMDNIKQHGLLQPIGVTKTPSKKYILIYGSRRLAACTKLGWQTIPAIINDEMSLQQHTITNIIENLQRVNNTPHELGRVVVKLMKEDKMSINEIASRLNTSKNKITSALDVYSTVPLHLKDRVKFMTAGTSAAKNGNIAASLVLKTTDLKRSYGLNKDQYTQLLDMAQQGNLNSSDLNIIAGMIREGVTPATALKEYNKYIGVPMRTMLVEKNEFEKFKKKHSLNGPQLVRAMAYGELKETFTRPYFSKELKSVK